MLAFTNVFKYILNVTNVDRVSYTVPGLLKVWTEKTNDSLKYKEKIIYTESRVLCVLWRLALVFYTSPVKAAGKAAI